MELITLKQGLAFFIGVLAITNPIGNLAIFLSLTSKQSKHERSNTCKVATLGVGIILIIGVWLGEIILNFFGISIGDFQIAGSIVLGLMGLSMLNSKEESSTQNQDLHDSVKHDKNASKHSIAIVPLAIPMVAGPGALATIIVATHQYSDVVNRLILSAELLIITLIIFAAFNFATPIGKMIGKAGANIATKIMGLIIMSMAVNMLVSGVARVLPLLGE